MQKIERDCRLLAYNLLTNLIQESDGLITRDWRKASTDAIIMLDKWKRDLKMNYFDLLKKYLMLCDSLDLEIKEGTTAYNLAMIEKIEIERLLKKEGLL